MTAAARPAAPAMQAKDALTFGSLFSGIGGFDLGFERAGMRCLWLVEINDFCRRVLAKHWPNVARHGDIMGLSGEELERVYVVCLGFPCQPVSYAGEGLAQEDARWLWPEALRIIRVVRPVVVVVENVSGLLGRGMGIVLGDLAASGYDAEWQSLPACAFGAPHTRQRVFIVAHANSVDGWPGIWYSDAQPNGPLQTIDSFESTRAGWKTRLAHPSELYRDADGLPFGMDRNRAIGNAVVPQVAEWIGRRIMAAQKDRS